MRVLVFRDETAARGTARRLEDAGHTPLLAPVLRIVAAQIPPPPGRFDALLATSAQAFGLPSPWWDGLRSHPVFTVGGSTAEAARRAGFRDIRRSDGDGAALVALVRLTLPRPAGLLYAAGRDRKPTVELGLPAAGYTVETFVAYEAEALDHWPEEALGALRTGNVDAALHFSRRSADLALTLADRYALRPVFLALGHVCLSEDVASPLRGAGAARIDVAPRPDEAGLLSRLPDGGR